MITYQEAFSLNAVLNQKLKDDLPASEKLHVVRTMRKVQQEVKDFTEAYDMTDIENLSEDEQEEFQTAIQKETDLKREDAKVNINWLIDDISYQDLMYLDDNNLLIITDE